MAIKKKRFFTSIIIASLFSVLTPALSSGVTVADLRSLIPGFERAFASEHPASKDHIDAWKLMYYVAGVADTYNGVLLCYPSDVTNGQTVEIVIKYIKDHPEEWHKRAPDLVYKALAPTFGCKK